MWKRPRLITTVSRFLVHCDAVDLIWAELTMFTGPDGRPVYDGAPNIVDGQPTEGTFGFLVSEMQIGAPA